MTIGSTADTETRLRIALRTIQRAWPDLQNPPQATAQGLRAKPSSRPPASEGPLTLRTELTLTLAYWTHALADQVEQLWGVERPVPEPGLTQQTRWTTRWVPAVVDCRDVPLMCQVLTRHATWITGWAEAPRILNDLELHAREAKTMAWPPVRETLVIGECPIIPEGLTQPCGGQVRARRTEDWAVCRTCRTGAVMRWWREKMPPPPPEVTAQRLVLLLAIDAGTIVTESTIRQWRKRGDIRSSGYDHKRRRLYRWQEIVDREKAKTEQRMQRAG